MRKDSYRYIFWSSCAAILEIFYTYGLYEDIGAFINKNTANVEEYLDSKAQTRAPEDPEHPDRPITSQIKNDKRGRRRMIKETKEQGEKKKNTSGAHWDIHFHKIEPRWDWAHVQRHYKGTWGANDLFSLLGACSNWGFTGGYEGWRSQYDLHLNNQITLNWIIEIGKNYVWFFKKNTTEMNKIRLIWSYLSTQHCFIKFRVSFQTIFGWTATTKGCDWLTEWPSDEVAPLVGLLV